MKKEEGAAGERTKRKGVWLVTSLNVEEMKLLVDETPGGVYLSLVLAQPLGKKSTPEKRYRCYDLEFCV